MAVTAPDDVRFCPRCGAGLVTREVSGQQRRACPACGHVHFTDPKVGVGVMVVRHDGLLLVRRVMDPERGRWALPGGFLDAGEDPRAKAAEEAREEAGVVVAVTGVLDVFGPADGGATLFVLYRADWVSGEPVAGDDADAAGFFGPDRLPDLAFASTRAAVRHWLAGG